MAVYCTVATSWWVKLSVLNFKPIDGIVMITSEHLETARQFLLDADREFEAGGHTSSVREACGVAASHVLLAEMRRSRYHSIWSQGDGRCRRTNWRGLRGSVVETAVHVGRDVARQFLSRFSGCRYDFKSIENLTRQFVDRVWWRCTG